LSDVDHSSEKMVISPPLRSRIASEETLANISKSGNEADIIHFNVAKDLKDVAVRREGEE